jgi:nucleoside-diphosphate-sugar epimerase
MADTVLITGGSGFIGTHLSRALVERGDKVVNFDLYPRNRELAWLAKEIESAIAFEQGDVSQLTQLIGVLRKHRPNKIAHLAASIDMASLDSFPAQVPQQMVGGTVNVLEGMRLLGGVERLVSFSSIGVLPTRQYEPIDCNHPTLMANEGSAAGIYGAGKIASEAFCWAYADLFSLDIVQLRPSAAYGFFTRNTIFMNEMLEGALRGEPVRIPHGRYLARDYTHVLDIVGIAVAALDAKADKLKHRCFYAASGMNPLVNAGQIADLIRDMVPSADIEIGETLTPMLERYEVKMRGVLDVKPVEEQLEYKIRFRDIRAGLAENADRYSEYLSANGKPVAKRRW